MSFDDACVPLRPELARFALRLANGDYDAAEDLAQETLLRGMVAWNPDRPPSNPLRWLRAIARHLCVDSARRRAVRVRRSAQAARELHGEPIAIADDDGRIDWSIAVMPASIVNEGAEDRQLVRAAVEALPIAYRAAARLRFLDGQTLPAIAREMRCPIATACTRTARARRLLEHELAGALPAGRVRTIRAA